jgi:DNA repair exonuclease SbcCD nuclease subunit
MGRRQPMRILFFTDLHYGIRANRTKYLNIADDVVDHVIDMSHDRKIDVIIFGGDLYDNRNSINVKTLNRAHAALHRLTENTDCEIYLIVGNHDLYYRTSKEYSSTIPLRDISEKMHIVSSIEGYEWEGRKVLLAPWLTPSDVADFLKEAKTDWDLCFGHFEIKGFELNVSGFKNRAGFDSKVFKRIKKLYSGHFHKQQVQANIKYVGSPYQIDFGEEGDTKGFTIIDLPSLKEEFVENHFSPRHHRVYYSKKDSYKKRNIYNNIIRPVIDEDVAPDKILTWEKKLKSWKPLELQPSTFTTAIESIIKDTVLEDIPADPVELMMVFLETLVLPEDIKKGTLKKVIRGLFEDTAKVQQLVRKNNHVFVEKVEFKNLFSFGNKWEKLEPKKGINLVMGPNGAGKTGLLESILVGFYGKSARKLKKEGVVNKTNKRNCEIKVSFRNNQGEELRIERGLKPQFLRYYKNGELRPQEADLRIYQRKLEKFILSCDYQTWVNLQFISLNKTQPFLSLYRQQKREFLERILDLTVFKDVYMVIQAKLKTFEKKLAVHEKEAEIFSGNIMENRKLLRNLASTYKQLKSGKEERITTLSENLEKAKTNLSKKENQKEDLQEKIREIEDKKRDFIETSRALNKDIITKNTEISNAEKHLEAIKEADQCHWCFQDIDNKTEKNICERLTKQMTADQRQATKLAKEQEKIDKKQ